MYLNIWKADDSATEKKTVMVWIHDGGFEACGTVDPMLQSSANQQAQEVVPYSRLSKVFNHPEMTADTGRRFDKTFSNTMRKMWLQFAKTGNPSLNADISPDVKAKEWSLYDVKNKKVMVFDEFNIHTEKESALKILDWDRIYSITKYYWL